MLTVLPAPREPRPHPASTDPMKEGIHPENFDTTITCTCGAVYHTRSTVKNLRIGICAACHPFFTGEQRFVDTAGRVDKFAQRYGSLSATRRKPAKAAKAEASA